MAYPLHFNQRPRCAYEAPVVAIAPSVPAKPVRYPIKPYLTRVPGAKPRLKSRFGEAYNDSGFVFTDVTGGFWVPDCISTL